MTKLPNQNTNLWSKIQFRNKFSTLAFALAFVAAGFVVNIGYSDLQANILASKRAEPYNGLVMPIKKSPDWVGLNSSQWKLPYSQIPADKLINIPAYIPSQLTIPSGNLNWSKPEDRLIRNAQVTYSVPYMGNYKLDGQEFAGSHLAVDIKIPEGTPIYAIGNGVVTKVSQADAGFGKHIVVRHDDFPSFNNPNQKTTYFSSYSHLSNTMVNVGDIVAKNQQIAESGSTGTSTTPHLHFQIDNDTVDWHPYWPFTGQESAAAGLGFFESINAGLGKDKALAATISPVAYVQKYLDGNSVSTQPTQPSEPSESNLPPENNTPKPPSNDDLPPTTPDQNPEPTQPSEPNEVIEPETPVIPEEPEVIEVAVLPSKLELKYDKNFALGSDLTVKVLALDAEGKIINKVANETDLYIRVENGSAKLSTSFLLAKDFNNGIAEFKITPQGAFGMKFSVEGNGIKVVSDMLQSSAFSDLNQNNSNYVAINFLKDNNVIQGYPDGTFKAENPVSRVEALKFIYEGLNKRTLEGRIVPFKDTSSTEWYGKYLAAGIQDGVIQGYEGNVFKPENQVTRAEFLKMLLETSGDGNSAVSNELAYSDIESGSWYAKYFSLAKDKNLLAFSGNIVKPHEPLTRGEVSEILYRLMIIKSTNKAKFERTLAANY